MILNWCSMFIPDVPPTEEDEDAQDSEPSQISTSQKQENTTSAVAVPSIERMHRLWNEWSEKYKAALATPIPLGRHKGEMLKQVGKRDCRWLLHRIPLAGVVDETL